MLSELIPLDKILVSYAFDELESQVTIENQTFDVAMKALSELKVEQIGARISGVVSYFKLSTCYDPSLRQFEFEIELEQSGIRGSTLVSTANLVMDYFRNTKYLNQDGKLIYKPPGFDTPLDHESFVREVEKIVSVKGEKVKFTFPIAVDSAQTKNVSMISDYVSTKDLLVSYCLYARGTTLARRDRPYEVALTEIKSSILNYANCYFCGSLRSVKIVVKTEHCFFRVISINSRKEGKGLKGALVADIVADFVSNFFSTKITDLPGTRLFKHPHSKKKLDAKGFCEYLLKQITVSGCSVSTPDRLAFEELF